MNRYAAVFVILILIAYGPARANDYADGEKAFDSGDYKRAVAAFSGVIAQFPRNAGIYIIRGIAYHKLGEYNKAIDDFTKAIQLDSKSLFYTSHKTPYIMEGQGQDSLKAYERAIELYARSFAYYCRGNSYSESGNLEQAIENYTKAVELYPLNTDAYFNRGHVYNYSGKTLNALKDWIQAANLGHEGAQNLLKEKGIRW
ncbi:MAG TPA: tetratricopeptide repeat protein [archaeon]|nr:tetratricopeptide repeat protein [archaeon]